MKAAPAAHLCIVMPEFAGGGAQRIGVNLANFYARAGMPVTVLVFRDKGPLRNDLLEKVRVISLDSSSRNPYRKIARALRQLRPSSVLTMYRNVNVPVGLSRLFFSGYRLVVREANTLNAIMEKRGLRRWKNLLKLKLAYRTLLTEGRSRHLAEQVMEADGMLRDGMVIKRKEVRAGYSPTSTGPKPMFALPCNRS